jgi:hypothetical protein
MPFLIADTFAASLTRLTGDEQMAVKTAAFDDSSDQLSNFASDPLAGGQAPWTRG